MTCRFEFRRRYGVVASALALFLVIAACGSNGDDETTPTLEAAAATGTPAAIAQETPTPEVDATPTEDATATPPAATPTVTEATATVQPAASTPTELAATPTVGATATPDEDDLLGDIEMLDPEAMPNYTLTMRFEMSGIPDEPEDFVLEMDVQQSATDNYHLRIVSDEMTMEVWVVDGVTYLSEDGGSITSVPGTDMGFFSPSMFLATVPPLDAELEATRVGEETVSGRETTRYRINAAQYLALSELFVDGMTPDDASGELNVWIDNELNIMIRQEGDITWTNEDGTTGRFVVEYLVHDIGSTSAVQAPQ